ncbi:MAG: hypothetical protein JO222_02165, partial [Frankiales bacterium]|nr:hypothetical protein [Frankiales bacterium]
AALRQRLEPPQFALPQDDLVEMLRGNAVGGEWTPELAAAVLPIFEVGPDGLARARLPFDIHMAIVDTLLDYDAATVLGGVRSPAWLVACERPETDDAWRRARDDALATAVKVLADPRVLRWGGAVHDVPLQWPALVAGLIRAAAADLGGGRSG